MKPVMKLAAKGNKAMYYLPSEIKKDEPMFHSFFMAGDLGLEPRTTESESAMLPITPIANVAGVDGFEPPLTVLETARLPLS